MRSFNRFKTDQDIRCSHKGKLYKAGLYNLSCGGCMIEAAHDALVPGDAVQIALNPKIRVPGHIVWRVDKNIGIKFDVPVHQTVLEHFGYRDELFDGDDPRDRFGIPLTEMQSVMGGSAQ